jgi:hypothetical protein
MQEAIAPSEGSSSQNRIPIAFRLDLRDKANAIHMFPSSPAIGIFISWTDYDADRFDSCRVDFLDNHFQGGFFAAVAVDQPLQGERGLAGTGRRNNSFIDLHGILSYQILTARKPFWHFLPR